MKTITICLVLSVWLFGGLALAQDSSAGSAPEKEYKLSKAYAHRDEQLLLSATDYFSCFVFDKNPDMSLIISDVRAFSDDSDFSNPDMIRDGQTVFLNRGDAAGLKKGQRFLISSKTNLLYKDHHLVIRNGIGEIVNVHAKTAELRITALYNPVQIGDFLVEYKPEADIAKLKIPYQNAVIPEDADSAPVYLPDTVAFGRTILGEEQFVAVEMGKDKLSVGEFLVFYRRLKPHLPPFIMATGVAVVVGDHLSTVKIIDASSPVVAGSEAAVLPEPKIIEGGSEGPVPVVRRINDVTNEAAAEEMLSIEISFAIDSFVIDESQSLHFVKLKEFIQGKTAYSIRLKGYTCSIGGYEANLELSKKRVDAVQKMLIEQLGVPESQLESAFYGEKEAPYDNSIEAERKKNRLVVVVAVGR